MHFKLQTHHMLLGAACLLLLMRFVFLGDTPFINDEPSLLLLLDAHEARGTFPRHGLYGSQPIPYGPVALWFYSALRLFSASHTFLLIGFIFVHCAALMLLYSGLCFLCSKRSAAWTLLLASSSPYLYFYSRLLWDNNLLIPISAGLFWLVSKWWRDYEEGAWQWSASEWFLFGILLALALNTHLMSGFLLIALCGAAFFLLLSTKTKAQTMLKLGAYAFLAFVLLSLPYISALIELWPQISAAPFEKNRLPAMDMVTTFFRSTWYLGYESYFEYFYRYSIEDFERFTASIAWLRRFQVAWVLRMAVLFMLIRPFLSPGQFKGQPLRIGLSVLWILHCAGEFFLGATQHPHYYISIWWLPFVGVALLLSQSGLVGRLIHILCAATVLCNVVVMVAGVAFIHHFEGTRGQGYGPTLANQTDMVDELCASMQAEGRDWVALDWSQTQIFSHSIQYLMTRHERCQGKQVGFVPKAPVVLRYADTPEGSARLVLERRSEGED